MVNVHIYELDNIDWIKREIYARVPFQRFCVLHDRIDTTTTTFYGTIQLFPENRTPRINFKREGERDVVKFRL